MEIIDLILASPSGVSAGQLEKETHLSRPTINRRLLDAVRNGVIVAIGEGAARKYINPDPLLSIRAFFNTHHTSRPFARYDESLLDYSPALDESIDLSEIYHRNDCDFKVDRRDMVSFLVDFACASSALEGGTYSMLDTQSLIEYGEKAAGKPTSDAFLVLNHKNAFEYIFDNLSLDGVYASHQLLTDDHGLKELQDVGHFLDSSRQGVVREYAEVRIGTTAYSPTFRPGTGYVKKMMKKILDTASLIENPLESAFYLLTRIPYLQPFEDGNKRTSRLICNVPLMQSGLPPISFMDFIKQDYIISILAFYELGDTRFFAKTFARAYLKSCERIGFSIDKISVKPRF